MKKYIKQGYYGAYFFFRKKKCLDQNDLVNANPDMNLARDLWNILENKLVLQAMEIILPSVKINKKICLPMCDTLITRENIQHLPSFEASQTTSGNVKISQILRQS